MMKKSTPLPAWLALLLMVLLSSLSVATAQNTRVTWKILTPSVTGAPGEVVKVKIQAKIAPHNHMYTAKTYADGPSSTEVSAGEASLLSLAGKLLGPKPISLLDPAFETVTEYWEGTVTLTVPVRINAKATPGSAEGWVNFNFQTCDESSCMPPSDKKLTFAVNVTDKKANNLDSLKALETARLDSMKNAKKADTASTTAVTLDTATVAPDADSTATTGASSSDTVSAENADGTTVASVSDEGRDDGPTGSQADIEAARKKGLGAFLALAALMGLSALGTPCVFPMIPITVSFFTKRKQTTRRRTIRDAGFYSLGIILTFTALGFIITLASGGAAGIPNFAASPWTNLFIAAVFLLLALNLFGMFEIQLPTSILNRLNKKADGDGVGSIVMMGLVFSLTSFTCTVPFIGSVLVLASKGDWLWPLMGTAVFAAVFSLPFFFLAIFPSLLKSLPKAGGWLNSVKVVMGFIEVAAAIKFLANADLVWGWGVFSRELFLSIWIAVAALISVYLLGRFQLPHDTPVDRVGPVRLLFSIGFLAIGFWLLQGLFGGNLGEVDAQLPPPAEGAHAAGIMAGKGKAPESEPTWIQDDYEGALKISQSSGKPIFIDFTGYTCTNCRWMERNMFSRKEISNLMDKYILVRLYTDRPDAINKKNQKMQLERFKTITLPYYAIISPSDSTIAQFPGMTRKAEQFVDFLRKGVSKDMAGLSVAPSM
jgi:thiol:disulfide interchange protein DsbD